eukprot:GHVQ01039484.1.p1 GENE.GHVQ01039484.1~~GHVQ01039484.1.p1  ORF type:complete len:101 (+),score=8.50 GHVQ01039484.1:82-384(+)
MQQVWCIMAACVVCVTLGFEATLEKNDKPEVVCSPATLYRGRDGTRSVGDKQYILGVVDEYSKYTTVYFLGCESEALGKLNEYIQSVAKPSIIRSDNTHS